MFTQTFITSNSDQDPALVPVYDFAETDTTDTSAYGFTNSAAVAQALAALIQAAPGFVETVITENTPNRVSRISVWETEAQRDTFMAEFRANTNLYTAYSELMARFRAHFNCVSDPAPNQAPHYFP